MYFLIITSAIAQKKYEKEIRLDSSEVPTSAIAFVDALNYQNKIKWYRESGANSISFEAKVKKSKKRHSVEFSKNGVFEDIEIEIQASEMPSKTYSEISQYLTNEHYTYKLKKVQLQYSGDEKAVKKTIINGEAEPEVTQRYELVISSKVNGSFKMFEYLFAENGAFIKKMQISLAATDNLEY